MSSPPEGSRRSAAFIATAVAVPVMLIFVAVSVLAFGGSPPAPAPSSSPPAAVGPVSMPAPPLDAATAEVCRAVVADLPDSVLGRTRRPVSAGPEQNGAYGDPPITLACGVAAPTVGLTDIVYPLSGVCWIPSAPSANGVAWTTVDRVVPVQVVVPGAAEGSAQAVIEFSAAVGEADPVRSDAPSGCR